MRVHVNGLGSGSSAAINVRSVAPSRDEPNVEFVVSTSTVAAGAVAVGDPVGAVSRAAFSANFGSHVKVELVATKGAGACDFTISVDIVVKD